jgi:hypothetical protein
MTRLYTCLARISLRSLRPALLVLLALTLAACEQTRFESLPTGTQRDCDPAWVGNWLVTDNEADSDEEPGYWVVKPDCSGYQTVEEEGLSEEEDEFRFRYIQQKDQSYLAVAERPDPKSDDQAWENAFMLIRYQFRGPDEIRLYAIDDHRLAELIVAYKIPGRTEVSSGGPDQKPGRRQNSINNLVYGDSKATDAVIKRRDAYDRKPWLLLKRVSDEELARIKAKYPASRGPESG